MIREDNPLFLAASPIKGDKVYNMAGEHLGKIEDIIICIRLRDKMHESVIFYAKISTFKSENHYTWYSKLCIKFVNR
ncbi:hypothetical protein BGV40_03740 [Methanosarcina sp. Ant1]|nr:hypothetical protein BGV40_03740 [Methanosarcina sp. Ant1]